MSETETGQWHDGLPPRAGERVRAAAASGTWGSALGTDEFAAIRSAGFEPVGQVMGSAVFYIGYQTPTLVTPGPYDCGYYYQSTFGGPAAPVQRSRQGAPSRSRVDTFYRAQRLALDRMSRECLTLRGDGVVAVDYQVTDFPSPNCLEFQMIGTAVRARGAVHPQRPFTSHLSGQDFAKLVTSGWVPVSIALGMAIGVRHDDWGTVRQTRNWFSNGNQEVEGWTRLVNVTRQDARGELRRVMREHGAEGVVVDDMRLGISETRCRRVDGEDRVVEASILGTMIASFRVRERRAGTLSIMSLDPKRRAGGRSGNLDELGISSPNGDYGRYL